MKNYYKLSILILSIMSLTACGNLYILPDGVSFSKNEDISSSGESSFTTDSSSGDVSTSSSSNSDQDTSSSSTSDLKGAEATIHLPEEVDITFTGKHHYEIKKAHTDYYIVNLDSQDEYYFQLDIQFNFAIFNKNEGATKWSRVPVTLKSESALLDIFDDDHASFITDKFDALSFINNSKTIKTGNTKVIAGVSCDEYYLEHFSSLTDYTWYLDPETDFIFEIQEKMHNSDEEAKITSITSWNNECTLPSVVLPER